MHNDSKEPSEGAAQVVSGPNPSGLCMCGCGQKTPIAKKYNPRYGHIKGQPTKFTKGHNGRTKSRLTGPPNPSGLCMCGCGRVTTIVSQSSSRRGRVAGQHSRFIVGHAAKGLPARRTHCRRGHEYSVVGRYKTNCRECLRERNRRVYHRLAQARYQAKIEADRLLLETVHFGDEKAQKMIALMFNGGATEPEREVARQFLRRRRSKPWQPSQTTSAETRSTQPETKSPFALASSRGA